MIDTVRLLAEVEKLRLAEVEKLRPELKGKKKPKKTKGKKNPKKTKVTTAVSAEAIFITLPPLSKARRKRALGSRFSHVRLQLIPQWTKHYVYRKNSLTIGGTTLVAQKAGHVDEALDLRKTSVVTFPRSVWRRLDREMARLAHQKILRRDNKRVGTKAWRSAVILALVEFALDVRGVY